MPLPRIGQLARADDMRRRNERIASSAKAHRFGRLVPVPFLCECSDRDCDEMIRMPLADFRANREAGDYLAAPGHTVDGASVSRVTDHCWVHRRDGARAA